MNKKDTIEIYRRRIAAAVEYINLHLDEELELVDIAAVANFSPYHFHRIFKAFRGEPLGSYVSRLRVETAAHLLVLREAAGTGTKADRRAGSLYLRRVYRAVSGNNRRGFFRRGSIRYPRYPQAARNSGGAR